MRKTEIFCDKCGILIVEDHTTITKKTWSNSFDLCLTCTGLLVEWFRAKELVEVVNPSRNGHGRSVEPLFSRASDMQSTVMRPQSDSPTCDSCGSLTVRNGSCYRCHNCGNSMGCS